MFWDFRRKRFAITRKQQLYDWMAPGRWYGMSEMNVAMGWPRNSIAGTVAALLRWGAIEKTRDPEGGQWRDGSGKGVWVYRRREGFEPPQRTHRKDGRRWGNKAVRW